MDREAVKIEHNRPFLINRACQEAHLAVSESYHNEYLCILDDKVLKHTCKISHNFASDLFYVRSVWELRKWELLVNDSFETSLLNLSSMSTYKVRTIHLLKRVVLGTLLRCGVPTLLILVGNFKYELSSARALPAWHSSLSLR